MTQEFEKEQKLLIDQIDTVNDVIDTIGRFQDKFCNKPAAPLPENLKSTLDVATDKLQKLLKGIKLVSDANN